MSSQFHSYKTTRIKTPDFLTAPAQGMFESRPFVVQPQPPTKPQQQLDLKTALMREKRYGYDLTRMDFTADSSTPTYVQPKMRLGQNLLGHKPTHMVQQRAGKVPVPQGLGTPITGGDTIQCAAKRPSGISEKLARSRWKMKPRQGFKFREWKKGYEAQHIIPYGVASKLKLPLTNINQAWNGMMLPSGRKGAAAPLYKANTRFKQRPNHIKKGWSHPIYSKHVEEKLTEALKKNPTLTPEQVMKNLADELRQTTKKLSGAVDDIK